jgi:FixJ family two-component response regulator
MGSSMSRRRKVIAVVDDDAGIRDALVHLLSAHGYGTEAFSLAEEYLDAALTSKAMCLVSDIQMGGISGIHMVRQLSATGFKLPVIFMTGCESEATRGEAMEVGCVAYLRKPFSPHLLLEAIVKAIGASGT